MANYYLENGMALRKQREINDANRYGTPSGCHQIHGTVSCGNGSFWNSSNDTTAIFGNYPKKKSSGHYLGNGQYVED